MISVKNINFAYREKLIIDDISINLSSDSIGILGPNGSGKTTLLKIISGLLKSNRGDVFIDNSNILNFSPLELAKIFAIVSQEYEPTYGFSVEEIIEMGRYPYLSFWGFQSKSDRKIINQTIELLNIESLRKNKTDDLSSGERQKVRFARALVQEPKYLLLDEPTSNLDLSNKLLVTQILSEIKEFGTNIIITSHDIDFIRYNTSECNMLSSGSIIYSGLSKNVINKKNIKKLFSLDSLPNWII
ncbi:MAG: hypothetical protein CL714_04445 [Chloroflexi bacterium]|nr:hypothetical protein [Chloroflexota bacterium]|tara:strand:+ start:9505 stop:10236 length:732 start_codon:yes stop_codon:yes gene_type:complete